MSMGGGHRGSRVSGGDAEAQRAENAAAPRIPNLLPRIAQLFRPHRARLTLTIALVLVSAGLSVLPPLLTQQAFDRGLFPPEGGPNIPVLTQLVSLMLLLWMLSAGLGIAQTLLTATVGNAVMAQLRVRLFAHLQAMELGFFTRTKTGAIQSRLQNDVGGVAGVLNNTVSSVIGNTVTVIAAFIAMLILSWQLTVVAVILLPLLVVAQRRVGQVRARIAGKTQESLSDMSAITQESLSVSGILLAKSFFGHEGEVERYRSENEVQRRLQVQLQMSGQWFFAIVNVFLSVIPAVIYLVAAFLIEADVAVTAGTIVAFTTVQARLTFPLLGLMRVTLDLQTSAALFARIFEYLDLRPTITEAPDASDEELEAACRAANIHETIDTFPDGYATVVGERGYRLSGGEKQRVAIARVLLKDPPVLILDEATSALDSVSERVVQRALDSATRGRTTIAIAHRLSTISAADVIHVVDGGRIVESGAHAELVALGGVYARLVEQQSADYDRTGQLRAASSSDM